MRKFAIPKFRGQTLSAGTTVVRSTIGGDARFETLRRTGPRRPTPTSSEALGRRCQILWASLVG
jgi:hypothetical protein